MAHKTISSVKKPNGTLNIHQGLEDEIEEMAIEIVLDLEG